MGLLKTTGFTLIELIIAIGLATLMSGALAVVVIQVVSVQSETLQKQEVLQNIQVITETMARYMRLAEPHNEKDTTQHSKCVYPNTYFGGLDALAELQNRNTNRFSDQSYIQFLSPIDQSLCMRFYLDRDGVVRQGTHKEGEQWRDYRLTAQEEVSVVSLEIIQGGTAEDLGLNPMIFVLIEAGKEVQGTTPKEYKYRINTQVIVAVRNLSKYPKLTPSDTERVITIADVKRTKNTDPTTPYRNACWYNFTLNINADAMRQVYDDFNVPMGHICENSLPFLIYSVYNEENKIKVDSDEHQGGRITIPTGSGIHTISYPTDTPGIPLPCDTSLFAARIIPFNEDANCKTIGSRSTYKENYWSPFILPVD